MRVVEEVSPSGEEAPTQGDRKAEHIRLALSDQMQLGANFFDRLRFPHCALPELDLDEIDLSLEFLGKPMQAPLLISCMTGGTERAAQINRNLATAAERSGVAFGVGSQRKALEDPDAEASFEVRSVAPTAPLLANLGAVQLNYGCGPEECRRVVEMIDADALVFHLNPLQEAIQPEGQTNFAGLLAKMAKVVEALEVPVIAKEIGCGVTAEVAESLARIGIRIIDTAGLGGTSWARIEARRASDPDIGDLFADWGIPTPDSIRQLAAVPGVSVIGSGGIRNGIDVAKALALGSDVVGMAYPFLEAATRSAEAVEATIARAVRELKICMLCLGARNLSELRAVALVGD